MQLASGTHIPDGLLAAMTLLNEKPRHGVASKNVASNPGIGERNSTVAIGFRASLALDAVRQSERARYYASTMGRYLSPDWSKNPEGVPYADFTNPQTLNLYSYVKNNPLSAFDDDGHATIEVKYNPLSLGSNHSFIVITDRDGTQTVFRAGPSISAGTGWITPATGGSASQSATPTSSQSDSSNSSSPGAGQTAQGNPWGQLYAQQESPTDPSGDNMSTISGSTTVLSNDLPASSYIQGLQQFDTGLNQANIPYNPLSTNSNAYVTNALQSIGVPTPKAPVWAPGAGTNLNVTPAPPAPPPPPPPPCSVAGACSQPQSH